MAKVNSPTPRTTFSRRRSGRRSPRTVPSRPPTRTARALSSVPESADKVWGVCEAHAAIRAAALLGPRARGDGDDGPRVRAERLRPRSGRAHDGDRGTH